MSATPTDISRTSVAAAPRRRAWWRISWSMRTLLLFMAVLALLLTWIGRTIRAVHYRAVLATALDEGSYDGLNWRDSVVPNDIQPEWWAIAFGDWSSVEITDIDISYRRNITDDLLEQASVFRKLDDISVNGQLVTDRGFAALNGMTELKTLNIEACDITDETMKHIGSCRNLEDLTLRGVNVTDKGFAHLWALPKLTSLTIEFTLISPKAVKAFQNDRPDCVVGYVPAAGKPQMEAAKGIMRRDANILYDSDTRLITALIFSMDEKPWRIQDWALLHAIPEIQSVSIDDLPSASEGIRQAQKLPNVERLTLEEMPVSSNDLEQLAQFPKLAELDFKPENLVDQHLVAISKLPNLKRLDIEPEAAKVTRRGIAALAQLKQLKQLKLSSVAILDEDLEPLAGLESLTVLDLSATPITDDALDHILKMPKLTELKLDETQITGKGAQRIMRSKQILSATWTDTGIKPEFFGQAPPPPSEPMIFPTPPPTSIPPFPR